MAWFMQARHALHEQQFAARPALQEMAQNCMLAAMELLEVGRMCLDEENTNRGEGFEESKNIIAPIPGETMPQL